MAKFCPIKHADMEDAPFAVSIIPVLEALRGAGLVRSFSVTVPEQKKPWELPRGTWSTLTGSLHEDTDGDGIEAEEDLAPRQILFVIRFGDVHYRGNSSALGYLMHDIELESIPKILATVYSNGARDLGEGTRMLLEARLTYGI